MSFASGPARTLSTLTSTLGIKAAGRFYTMGKLDFRKTKLLSMPVYGLQSNPDDSITIKIHPDASASDLVTRALIKCKHYSPEQAADFLLFEEIVLKPERGSAKSRRKISSPIRPPSTPAAGAGARSASHSQVSLFVKTPESEGHHIISPSSLMAPAAPPPPTSWLIMPNDKISELHERCKQKGHRLILRRKEPRILAVRPKTRHLFFNCTVLYIVSQDYLYTPYTIQLSYCTDQ